MTDRMDWMKLGVQYCLVLSKYTISKFLLGAYMFSLMTKSNGYVYQEILNFFLATIRKGKFF